MFVRFKAKAFELARSKWYAKPNMMETFTRTMDHIDDFYKNSSFFAKVRVRPLPLGFVDALREEAEYLFTHLATKVIVIDKLFARMTLLHKELMKELAELNNPSDVYQIAKCRLRKQYYFQEPFIATEEGLALSNDDLIISFAYSKDSFTISQLGEYADKMHLNRLDNYLAFIQSVSSDYIQISNNKLAKKESLAIDDEIIRLVRKELAFYIDSFGPIDSRSYKGYSSLPDIGIPWNKYLLAGIVRCYLLSAFSLETTGNHYDSYEFILKSVDENSK